jgi:hypothetical protein
MPPLRVNCPHCNSLLHIGSDGSIALLKTGMPPSTTRGATIAGAITGAVIGAMLGKGSFALVGTVAAALVGASADVREASYYDDSI